MRTVRRVGAVAAAVVALAVLMPSSAYATSYSCVDGGLYAQEDQYGPMYVGTSETTADGSTYSCEGDRVVSTHRID